MSQSGNKYEPKNWLWRCEIIAPVLLYTTGNSEQKNIINMRNKHPVALDGEGDGAAGHVLGRMDQVSCTTGMRIRI